MYLCGDQTHFGSENFYARMGIDMINFWHFVGEAGNHEGRETSRALIVRVAMISAFGRASVCDKRKEIIKSQWTASWQNKLKFALNLRPRKAFLVAYRPCPVFPPFAMLSHQSDSWWILNKALLSLRFPIFYCYVSTTSSRVYCERQQTTF